MSTFSGTIKSRDDLEEIMRNWNYSLVKPTAYTWGWFTAESEISCTECALRLLDEGKRESVDFFSFDQPSYAGESCEHCHQYIEEPFCMNCGTEGEDDNRLMHHQSGEYVLCRRCYLTALLTSKEVHNWHHWDAGRYE